MALLTFLLTCCVVTQQEGIMQDVYAFAGIARVRAHIAMYVNLH